MTHYVLREQEQWFEVEVPFIRRLLQPGMQVIDIGANYGCYALVMARAIGGQGHVWAFEPTSLTADCLSRSIEANGLGNITLIQAALSAKPGSALLSINPNSELNSLTADFSGPTEEVPVMTLDQCRVRYGWKNIDFVKLDAEGEEGQILCGGSTFLEKESPLVMFELRHGDTVNVPLIEQFEALGYRTYRLVPGLNILVPFSTDEEIDLFQLNLFCCKNNRAACLQEDGLLIHDLVDTDERTMDSGDPWQAQLFALPYAARFWHGPEAFARLPRREGIEEYIAGIESFFAAHREGARPNERYCALQQSLRYFEAATGNSRHLSRLCSYARVAGELGERARQNQILRTMLGIIQDPEGVRFDEPFIPACSRFDDLDPAGRQSDWFATSLFEQLKTQVAHSSYYTRTDSLSVLENIITGGFPSAEMERRLQLVRMRAGIQAGPVPSMLLSVRSAANLNPDYWSPRSDMGKSLS